MGKDVQTQGLADGSEFTSEQRAETVWGLQGTGADPLKGQGEAQVPGFVASRQRKFLLQGGVSFICMELSGAEPCFLYCSHANPLLTRREGRWGMAVFTSPSFGCLLGRK